MGPSQHNRMETSEDQGGTLGSYNLLRVTQSVNLSVLCLRWQCRLRSPMWTGEGGSTFYPAP